MRLEWVDWQRGKSSSHYVGVEVSVAERSQEVERWETVELKRMCQVLLGQKHCELQHEHDKRQKHFSTFLSSAS